jgi:uncharacterized membrane protein (DUF485 family)
MSDGSVTRAARPAGEGDRGPSELRALAARRTRVALGLTAGVFAIYFGFIAAVAWARSMMGSLIVPGLSVGILLGALVIVASWLLTWAYVRWANLRYDPVLRELRRR